MKEGDTGTIHRYQGAYSWEHVKPGEYPPGKDMQGVSVRWLIGPDQGAQNFCLRYFEVAPGGWTSLDQHAHDHGVFVLRGQGQVRLGDEEHEVSFGDVIFIPPHAVHQLKNTGQEPLGFLCVIPPKEKRE
jgi:quercetin dioxygenase-like cupin family protein